MRITTAADWLVTTVAELDAKFPPLALPDGMTVRMEGSRRDHHTLKVDMSVRSRTGTARIGVRCDGLWFHGACLFETRTVRGRDYSVDLGTGLPFYVSNPQDVIDTIADHCYGAP